MTETLRLRLPAEPASIGRIRHDALGFAADAGVQGEGLDAVALAVTEAVTNVVLHAYVDRTEPGEVWLTSFLADDALVVVCRDRGSGMRPRLDSPGLGVGLSLIKQSAATLEVTDVNGGGTEVRFTFTLG